MAFIEKSRKTDREFRTRNRKNGNPDRFRSGIRTKVPWRPSSSKVPFELSVGEGLNLRIFLDHSILEVYANSRQCITQRIYPTRSDSVGISPFSSDGSVNIKTIQAWDMASANN